jgi:hypothetical protein
VVLENKVCYHNYTTPANERGPASRLQAAPSENRLSSRSKLPKLERARFWGYSEIYCVAVGGMQAAATATSMPLNI